MDTRKIGSLDVSVVGIGCNNFGRRLDAAGTAVVVEAALEAGINFFDTADVYGNGQSEEYLSRALGKRRSQVIIATKFANAMPGQGDAGGHPDYIRVAVEASLRRLDTDCIDLYQMHVPDAKVPIADTLGALDDLVKAGKVREIGSSNFSAAQIRDAEAAVRPGGARFASVQNHYSLLHREDEHDALPECERLGLGYLPYFPLAGGVLTGKVSRGHVAPEGSRLRDSGTYNRFATARNLDIVDKLISFAEERGHTVLDVAFAWLLAKPVVASVIAGATKREQVFANAAAASWRLNAADLAALDAIAAES